MNSLDLSRYHPGKVLSYCPRCGQSWDFSSPNFFKCEGCGFSYYHGVSAAASGIILNENRELALIRRAHDPQKGLLDVAGGFLEYGETAEEGLAREIKEELNVSVTSMRYLGAFPNQYFFKGLLYYTIDITFICAVPDLSAVKPADDAEECVIRTLNDALFSELAFESTKQALKQLMEKGCEVPPRPFL